MVSVGDWEHECCGPAVERDEVRVFACERGVGADGQPVLVELRHGPSVEERTEVEVRGRVKDLLVVRDDGSREPVLRIPSGRALRGFADDEDGHLEDPWTGTHLPTGRHFLVVVDAVPSEPSRIRG